MKTAKSPQSLKENLRPTEKNMFLAATSAWINWTHVLPSVCSLGLHINYLHRASISVANIRCVAGVKDNLR